jgi:TonB-linked SusC/RagA family outer membrane protein
MKFFALLKSMQKIRLMCLMLAIMLTFTAISSTNATAYTNSMGKFQSVQNKVANLTISGTVLDETNQPLPGVSVQLKNSKIGTVTNLDGKFSLSVPDEGGILTFSFLSYNNYEVAVNQNTINLKIKLTPSASALNEVVVTAFGVQKKINVTGSVSTISSKDILASPVSNITNALIGNAPGISGLQNSGEPGRNGTKIYIRGIATFSGNSDPLIVIDGVEQPAARPYEQLNAMDANEIEGISILKDATSTAVYGVRAANGVIIVTTKRGLIGKPAISFSTNFAGTNATNLQNSASSYEYALARNRTVRFYDQNENNQIFNSLLFSDDELWKFQNNRDFTVAEVDAMTNLTAEQKQSLKASPALYYGNNDNYRDQFDNTGAQQQYNLNIRGGNEKVKYFTSFGYFDQGSILENYKLSGSHTGSRYNRSNFRSNFDINASKNTTISLNIAGQFGSTEGPAYGFSPFDDNSRYKQMLQYLQEGNTFMIPGIIDGRLITQVQNVRGAISPSNPFSDRQAFANTAESILLQAGLGTLNNTLLSTSVRINHKLDYLTEGLSIRGTANYDDSYSKYIVIGSTIPTYTVRRDPTNLNNLEFFGGTIPSVSFNGNAFSGTYNTLYLDAGIDYVKKIGGSNITALLLGKVNRYTIPNDNFNTPSGVMGLVSRVTYNYKERYQAEVNLGYNGTENFAPGNRFGFFPAYSAGWVPSSETFFPKTKLITFLKIRGSYGELGNDQILGNRYLFLPNTFNQSQGNYFLGTSNGVDRLTRYDVTTEGALGNPAVTWERSKKANIGLEARLFSDKLNLTVDLFRENRDNILTRLGTIPGTFGVAENRIPPVNVGITENKGYEVSLGWRDNVGNFSYGINGSISYAKNKVIFRSEPENPFPWQNLTGAPVGQYFGLTSDGFFNTPEELANRPFNAFNNNRNNLGDIRYKDLNGDNIINELDRSSIGFSNLPQYAFNSRINIGYKGFDLSVLFNGTARGSFYVPQNMVGVFFKNFGNLYQWQADGAWTPEKVANNEKITYPRLEINTNTSNSNFVKSDFWLRSSDFIKLKNIEIGYTLKDLKVLNALKISTLRVYANGNNLITFNNDLKDFGLDPETADNINAGYSNFEGYFFPLTRVYNFGLSVQF